MLSVLCGMDLADLALLGRSPLARKAATGERPDHVNQQPSFFELKSLTFCSGDEGNSSEALACGCGLEGSKSMHIERPNHPLACLQDSDRGGKFQF